MCSDVSIPKSDSSFLGQLRSRREYRWLPTLANGISLRPLRYTSTVISRLSSADALTIAAVGGLIGLSWSWIISKVVRAIADVQVGAASGGMGITHRSGAGG